MNASGAVDGLRMPPQWHRDICASALAIAKARFEANPEDDYEFANDAARFALMLEHSMDGVDMTRLAHYEVVRDAIAVWQRTQAPP